MPYLFRLYQNYAFNFEGTLGPKVYDANEEDWIKRNSDKE